MRDKLRIAKNLEGSGQDLIEGLSRSSPGGIERSHDKSEPPYQVSWLRVEQLSAEHVAEASLVLQPARLKSLDSGTIILVLCVKTSFRLGNFPTKFRGF
jgi:hypothetical protein